VNYDAYQGEGNGSGTAAETAAETKQKHVEAEEALKTLSDVPKNGTGRDTWLTPYSTEWIRRAGGEPNFGALARSLKPVEKKHGPETTLLAWRCYIDKTDPQFFSPASFASKIGHWLKESRPAFKGYG
jgi:hypothetical protein